MANCMYCGNIHQGVCARVKSIEYAEDGVTVRRVEFHAPQLSQLYAPELNIGYPPIIPMVGPRTPTTLPRWVSVCGPAVSNGTGD